MTNSVATLVCFAVKEEAGDFRRRAGFRPDIRILVTGMGERNARAALEQALAQQRPARVVTAGFAGGLDPHLERGTVVFFSEESTGLEPGLRGAGARPARFICTNKVVTTAAQKRRLFAETSAQAVEMESGPIQALCRARGIPAATIRVILDTANEDLVIDFNEVMTPNQQLDSARLVLALVKAPWKIAALLRLQRQSADAARRLGAVLEKVLLGSA